MGSRESALLTNPRQRRSRREVSPSALLGVGAGLRLHRGVTRDDGDSLVRDRTEIERLAVTASSSGSASVYGWWGPGIFVFTHHSPRLGTAASIVLLIVVIGCFLGGSALMDKHRPHKSH